MNIRKRPTVGVTLDSEQPGGYSKYPWYALRTGQLWQRLDQRPWPEIEREVRAAFTR